MCCHGNRVGKGDDSILSFSMAGVSDSESDVDEDAPQPFTYSEEQQKLKENFKSAASEWGGDGGEEKGDILVIRHKTKEEKV